MARTSRRRIQNFHRHPPVGDRRVGKPVSARGPRCRSNATTGRHLKCPLGLSIDATHRPRANADVLDSVVRIRPDLASGQIVRRVCHVGDGDRAGITHGDENPAAIWTKGSDRIRWSLEDFYQIGGRRLVRLLGKGWQERREHQARCRDHAAIRDSGHERGGWTGFGATRCPDIIQILARWLKCWSTSPRSPGAAWWSVGKSRRRE